MTESTQDISKKKEMTFNESREHLIASFIDTGYSHALATKIVNQMFPVQEVES